MKSNLLIIEPLEARIAPAVFIVTNLNDSGAGSLRAALAAADTHGGKNTIDFHLPAPPTHSENMITLTSGVLTSNGNITITGPGAGKLIINGNANSGIFNIDDGSASTDSPAIISGLTLINGKSGDGGAIYSSESLTLVNVTISGNTSTGIAGAVDADPTTPGSNVLVKNCLVTGNTAPDNVIGGLDIEAGKTVEVIDSIITGNSCKTNAGGAFIGNSSTGTIIVLSGDTITGNASTGGKGGGVFIGNYSTLPTGVTTISNCTISGNTSPTVGAGIYENGHGEKLNITKSTFSDNIAGTNGGGAYLVGNSLTTISKSIFSGNRTTKNTSGYGGGGLLIEGNGVTLQTAKITGTQFTGNQSSLDGGGLYATDGLNLNITGSTFAGNSAASDGGGVRTAGSGALKVNLTVSSGAFSNNVVISDDGGGVSASGAGTVSIIGSKVTGNVAGNDGGGIYANSTAAVLIKGVIATANDVTGGRGGGLAIEGTSTVNFQVTGGSFTSNSAVNGGGIYIGSSNGSIRGVTISGNVATSDGGGVEELTSTVTLQIAKVTANTAPVGPDVSGTFTFV
jgi:predicted outer membrane repeat protein